MAENAAAGGSGSAKKSTATPRKRAPAASKAKKVKQEVSEDGGENEDDAEEFDTPSKTPGSSFLNKVQSGRVQKKVRCFLRQFGVS